jgi:hypothetical protein
VTRALRHRWQRRRRRRRLGFCGELARSLEEEEEGEGEHPAFFVGTPYMSYYVGCFGRGPCTSPAFDFDRLGLLPGHSLVFRFSFTNFYIILLQFL